MSEIPPTSVVELRADAGSQGRSSRDVPSESETVAPLRQQRTVGLRGQDGSVQVADSLWLERDDAPKKKKRALERQSREPVAQVLSPPLQERSVAVLPFPPVEFSASAYCRAHTPGRRAPPIDAEVRCRPEAQSLPETASPWVVPHFREVEIPSGAQPYLRGGEECRALCRKYELTRAATVGRYETRFLAALGNCPVPVTKERIAQLAEASAKDSIEFVVRRAETSNINYPTLAAHLDSQPGATRRIGSFNAEAASSIDAFASFDKVDEQGATRTRLTRQETTAGYNKVHLNILREDMPLAWEALQPLLLSADNPFMRWKTIFFDAADACHQEWLDEIAERERAGEPGLDVGQERRDAASRVRRVTEGMQFTLYAITPINDPTYRLFGPQFRHFLTLLDWALDDVGARPGLAPESDVAIDGLKFSTYRHATHGTRGRAWDEPPITEEMKRRLTETSFYKAIGM